MEKELIPFTLMKGSGYVEFAPEANSEVGAMMSEETLHSQHSMQRKPRQTRNRTGSAYDTIVALLVKNGVVMLDTPEKARRIANYAKEQGLKAKLDLRPIIQITLEK